MSEERRHENDRPLLDPGDEAWVREVARATELAPARAAERVAFQEELDRRIARRSHRAPFFWGATGATTAALAVLAIYGLGGPESPTETPSVIAATPLTSTAPPSTTSLDALFSLVDEEAGDSEGPGFDDDLPADYLAINSLFLGS